MGMDVYGKNATTETGKYFRNNIWWWRPLAIYCVSVAPSIASKCKGWHHNDGDGLGPKDAAALANILQAEIDSGRCEDYAKRRQAQLDAMPMEACDLCEGTGIRKPIPQRGAGNLSEGGLKCNACGGTGKTEPWEKSYPFSVENVQEFVDFLRDSGGFEIC